MSTGQATRRFAPSLFATLLTIVGVGLFGRLGWWQLHRADEKQALLDQYAAGQHSIVDLTAAAAGTLPRYQQVRAQGHYDPAHQILLDNMPSERGQPGYRVVTPFELEQGGLMLVDRGWLAMGPTREALPDVTVAADARTIVGRLDDLPRAGIQLGNEDEMPTGGWPHVMNFPQHAAVEKALGRPVLKGLILLDPAQPDGYERAAQMHFSSGSEFGPQRHLAYAVQWFAMAAAAVVIYLILGFRRTTAATPDEQRN